ncbi:MAG: HEAT repeat domain-containing protein [Deltaproteobacteria bacterium]|nr:HEAT repeat domain-containing protein [Deltaproteobacteria bacterium]
MRNIRVTVFLVCSLCWLSVFAEPVQAGSPLAKRLIKALGNSSSKVRLKAATRIGQKGLDQAIPRLRKMVDSGEEKASVRAACLLALARLKDQDARGRMGYLVGHKNELIALAAEKGLLLLDKALPAEPVYLMELSPTKAPKGLASGLGKRVDQAMAKRIKSTNGVVAGAGEDSVLSDEDLIEHLSKRRLTGLLLKPEIMSLDEQNEPGRTTILAQVKVFSFSLPGKQAMHVAMGGSDAWIGDERISELERRDLQKEVLGNAADSALLELLQTLADEGL